MSQYHLTTFGDTIKQLRLNKNLPQRKVAALLDIDTSILSKYENNVRHPTAELIEKIAKIFDVDSQTLIFEAVTDKIAHQFIQEDIDKKTLKS